MIICKYTQIHKIDLDGDAQPVQMCYFLFIHTTLVFGNEYGSVTLKILFY